ncbi:MAG TPA: histidine phosphatase family protein [Acetobacteraceae bacterium]|jgi:probable phosphoglycerate mutase
MRALFHLVRHGSYALLDHAPGGRADYPLSSQGRDEAGNIAAWLAGRGPRALVSSPTRRAIETAAPIAQRLNLAIEVDPAFVEIDFADWTGKRFEDLHSDPGWRAWNGFRSTAGVPGGETMLGVQARAVAGLLRHAAKHNDAEVVVVSHADVIKGVLAHFLGTPLDLLQRIEIGPGSISQLMLYAAEAKVLAVNFHP